jgi:hypothetical protein
MKFYRTPFFELGYCAHYSRSQFLSCLPWLHCHAFDAAGYRYLLSGFSMN